jgi:toxin CcdB
VAQFDIYENKDERSRKRTPLLLDLQSEILSSLATRVVAPLRPTRGEGGEAPITRLHPIVRVGGTDYVAYVSELAAIPRSALGRQAGSCAAQREAIIAACDLILTGF